MKSKKSKTDITKQLNLRGPFSCINDTISMTVDSRFVEQSHVLLENSVDPAAKKLLLVVPNIEQQWNMSSNDIILGGHITMSSIIAQLASNSQITRIGEIDLTEYNAEIRRADSFFTDVLAVVDFPEKGVRDSLYQTVKEYQNRTVNVILPIREELLHYMTPEEISRNITIESTGKEITVTLVLPVSGKDGRNTITVYKTYTSGTEQERGDAIGYINEYDAMPLMQIWPNFIMSDAKKWQLYYTYYNACDNNTFHMKPYWEEFDHRTIQHYIVDAEIRQGKVFPTAFLCRDAMSSMSNLDSRLYGTSPVELGIILIKPPVPEPARGSGKAWTIGIDFGTTNTVAYYATAAGDRRVIDLESRMFNVCNQSKEGISPAAKHILRQNFLSPYKQPSGDAENGGISIRSMYHRHIGQYGGKAENPLFRGHIYYLDNSQNIQEDKNLNDVETRGLKWGDDSTSKENMTDFLMQLSLQCAVEAIFDGAARINWKYSYPTSFTRRNKEVLKNTWESNIKKLTQISDVIMENVNSDTESECIANYFVHDMNAKINSPVACLDIGGGSTDIAIWKENEIKGQTSLLLAGKGLLTDYLWKKKQSGNLPLLALKNNQEEFNRLIDNMRLSRNETEFNVVLEAFLKYYEKEIFDVLPMISGTSEVRTMLRDLLFAISGIFFYTGLYMGSLEENSDRYREPCSCYVGGNGSKLLDWAAEGKYRKDSLSSELYSACFVKGMEFSKQNIDEDSIFIYKTDRPKEEVAYGLVAEESGRSNAKGSRKKEDEYVAGEHFILGKKGEEQLKDIGNYIDGEQVMQGIRVDANNIPVFNAFIDMFNDHMYDFEYDELSFDERALLQICGAVNQRLSDAARENKNSKDVSVEPIFILMLKEAYRYLAER